MEAVKGASRSSARSRPHTKQAKGDFAAILSRTGWGLLILIVVLVPVAISPSGKDTFRAPKDALFVSGGLLLLAIGVFWLAAHRLSSLATAFPRALTFPLVGLAGWTILSTVTSTNRTLSLISLVWLGGAMAMLAAVIVLGRGRSVTALYYLFVPAAMNAVVFLLQRFQIWSPFRFDSSTPLHHQYTALLGNPDDVGSFFVTPAIVVFALLLSDRQRRVITVPLFLLLLAAILTGPITSAIACVIGLMAVVFVHSRRAGVIGSLALIITVTLFVVSFAPLRERLSAIRGLVAAGNYAEATSGRITPFIAALLMTRDHPLLGVGPSCFRWEYFPYKLRVEQMFPQLAIQFAHSFNFGETHNDHLQALAETGIVGYALGLAVLVAIAAATFRKRDENEPDPARAHTAQLICFPLAIALAVLCLGHFPLHLAASSAVLLFTAGLCYSWLLSNSGTPSQTVAMSPLRLIPAVAIAAAALTAVYFLAYRPYEANQAKRVVENETTATLNVSDPYVSARLARRNLAGVQGCANWWPPDVDCCMLAAANYRIVGRQDDAVAMYQRALGIERRPELYFSLADTQLSKGDVQSSTTNFAEAVRFNRDILADVPPQLHDAVEAAARGSAR